MTKYCGDIGKYLAWKAAKFGLNADTNNPVVKMGKTLSCMKFELLHFFGNQRNAYLK